MKLSIVIPAYNEEDNIETVVLESIRALSDFKVSGEIIIIDDASLDQTPHLLEELKARDSRIRIFRHPNNKGLGAALSTGYSQANGELVTWIPADMQIHPSELKNLLDQVQAADFVISNYIKRPDSWIRNVISKIWRMLTRLLLKYDLSYNGNYLFRRELLKDFNLKSTTGLFNLEFIHQARNKGYRVKEVTISCCRRLSGKSKVCNIRTVLKTFLEMFKLRFIK